MLLPLELIARLSLSRRVQWTTDQRLATPRKIPPRDKIDPQGAGVPADPASLRRRGRLPRVRLRQLAAVRLDRGSEEGTDGVSDDSSSALPDAALSRSLTRASDSGLQPRPPPQTLFYGETNSMNGRTAGPFLVLVVRTLSPFGHSRSLFFSPQLI